MHSFNNTKLAYDNTKVIEKISNWLAISISKTDDFELSSKYTQLKQIEIEKELTIDYIMDLKDRIKEINENIK